MIKFKIEMKCSNRILIFLILLFNELIVCAQDLTGTWEGDLNNTEFLQVNIVHVGDKLCGYTWDYLYNNKLDYCKALFTGRYDRNRDEWILTGTSFIANSSTHVLMRIKLSYNSRDGRDYLIGTESSTSPGFSVFSLFMKQNVFLKKVSKKPARMFPNMKDCMKEKQSVDIPPVEKKPSPVQKVKKQADQIIEKQTDTVQIAEKNTDTIPIKEKDFSPIENQMNKRKNTETSHLVVHEKNIILEVYDNGIIDSDTVSVFYNGNLILSHQRLSEKPIVIPISLDGKTRIHEIVLFAENLGSIPPNTALVVVKAGDKRYELFASANLSENAVIRFEYKPK